MKKMKVAVMRKLRVDFTVTTKFFQQGVFFMNKFQFLGHWNQIKGKVKEKFGKLTDDDLIAISGKRDQLIGKLQTLYGSTREKIEQQIKEVEFAFYAEELRIHWDLLKAKLKQKWNSLTEDDIQRIKGNCDKLIAQLQERYHFDKAKAEAEFHAFIDSLETAKEKVGAHWNENRR
jgi:uncharacterized protein YjbJ (UPF0337 family)